MGPKKNIHTGVARLLHYRKSVFASEVGMFWPLRNRTYSIGVDIEHDSVNLAQLANIFRPGSRRDGKGPVLIAGRSIRRPESIKPDSAAWQKWAVDAIGEATTNHRFHGRNVIAAMPACDVFIEHIKMGAHFFERSQNQIPKIDDEKQKAIFSKMKQKPPFEPDDAMVQYISTGQDNVLVMATERKIIDRHLAIYEKAGLTVKSIGAWPVALTNCYTKFFGRRKADLEVVVMLLDIGTNYTNIVICRHKNLLFAFSIPMGVKQLSNEKKVTRLVFELNACRSRFASMYPNVQIAQLIFLSGSAVDTNICKTIARRMEIQAQMGDCLAAVEVSNPYRIGIDRRNCKVSWATAFGLSLSIG